jgi:hypothetical protein
MARLIAREVRGRWRIHDAETGEVARIAGLPLDAGGLRNQEEANRIIRLQSRKGAATSGAASSAFGGGPLPKDPRRGCC